ncbi:hypothetical protein N431DRAFT_10072 [Stipitochalara longipes BDJ]|nr:hypothetical protein N431DRAFT_10072 [Stipitochalara longipes BDJ]
MKSVSERVGGAAACLGCSFQPRSSNFTASMITHNHIIKTRARSRSGRRRRARARARARTSISTRMRPTMKRPSVPIDLTLTPPPKPTDRGVQRAYPYSARWIDYGFGLLSLSPQRTPYRQPASAAVLSQAVAGAGMPSFVQGASAPDQSSRAAWNGWQGWHSETLTVEGCANRPVVRRSPAALQ